MPKFLLFASLLFIQISFSQKQSQPYNLGAVATHEINMTTYDKDTTANAVVLYEHGNTVIKPGILRQTTIYRKLKIINKEGEDYATVNIYLYDDGEGHLEKVKHIKAYTYNRNEARQSLQKDHIYTKRLDEHTIEVSFTFPNVKPGSVLEYQYNLESPFFFNFKGWTFQSEIPKIYSEFQAIIPGFWQYNRHLNGSLELAINTANIKKKCFEISGVLADCEDLTYAMKDIPAYIEEEYTTAKDNYISKIKFELSEIRYPDGRIKKYTKTWKDTDKILKYDKDIGKQLLSKNFYSKIIPENIYNIEDKLEKSKAIYKFIQSYFTLNTEDEYIYSGNNVRDAFKNKIAKVSEINLALVGALQSAGLNASIMLISTRDHGYPTQFHPVLTDFNYIASYLKIGEQSYLLDATDKFLPFNMLPLKTLNGLARVIDFNNGSFWHSTEPQVRSYTRTTLNLKLDNDQNLIGSWKEYSQGYHAHNKRTELVHQNKYLNEIENDLDEIEIKNLEVKNLSKLEDILEESYLVSIRKSDKIGDLVYLSPFLNALDTNPFQLKERQYPVDFGYKINRTYAVNITLPKNYKIESLPQVNSFKLPNNGGNYIVAIKNKGSNIQIYTKLALNKTKYLPNEYQSLKEFFNQIIKTQNSLIILKKI